MANPNGDSLVECGEDCRAGNNLLMAEGSEMEAVKKVDSDSLKSGEVCKMYHSNPVADELEIDSEGKKKKRSRKGHDNCNGRSFFDCNICLDMAREPVVTFCGHLFCWVCFYKLRYVDSTAKAKECPVCRGEVTDSAIIPIYGNGESFEESESESESGAGMNIPSRRKGQRTERSNQPVSLWDLLESSSGERMFRRASLGMYLLPPF